MAKEFVLTLDEPAYVKVATANGSKSAMIDVYAAHRLLQVAQAAQDEMARWEIVREYLASAIECEVGELAENVLIGFNNYICAIVIELGELRKKKEQQIASEYVQTASSPASTPASPANSPPGRQTKKKRGSKTSPA